MKLIHAIAVCAAVFGLASTAFAEQFDWERFRNQVRSCPSTDAHCVGLTMINIMQEVHGSNPGNMQIKCTCGDEGMGCYLKRQGGGITPISGNVPYTFSSNCEEMLPFAEAKGAFCDDGKQEDGKTWLWLIKTRSASFEKFREFTFSSDCEEAVEELK